ncbi:hypothetical protein JOC76_001588 [Neobacillus cucumis]|nr:hypothetical protein [Neobacillus cucumis]
MLDSSKMLSHFLRAWANSRKNFNVLREYGAEEAPRHASGFAEHLERKSTEHIFKRYPFFVDIFLLFFDKLIKV